MTFHAQGVIPACLLPFDTQTRIDESSFRNHLRDLAGVDGVTAVTVNGHASEVHALDPGEQQQALEIAVDALSEKLPVIAGVFASDGRRGAEIATMAAGRGAAALLVFPPDPFALGAQRRPEMALDYWERIASATELPLIVFQYPMAGGLGYPLDTLVRLCERIPRIVAIKDWCHDPPLHELQIRTLHGLPRRVNVLSTHSTWLLGSLVMGCDGILSGAGSVVADLQVALWAALRTGDLGRARRVNDRLFPTVQAFYRDPWVDMHNRMKEALVLLGRLPRAVVRSPLVALSADEVATIRHHLDAAGLTPDNVYRLGPTID